MYKVQFIGNLGRDPEMRYAPNGDAVTSISVATTRKYTDKSGQKVEETIWTRVSVWGKQAEACNTYLKKGSKVYVEGYPVFDKATGGPKIFTKKDGTSGAAYEVKAENVEFLSQAGNGAGHTEVATEAPGGEIEEPF